MEVQPMENSEQPTNNSSLDEVPQHQNNVAPHTITNGGEEPEHKLSAEEVKGTLEIIASTGKFWQDWDELKTMLSFQLKQVLSEYPEAMKSDVQENSSSGESYSNLVKRLEEALFSFTEGPPFTLQRLCEILLNARVIYPNLSKLTLALEKNLLVTSILTRSTDPYPSSMVQLPDAPEDHSQEALPPPTPPRPPHSNPIENGREPIVGDRDEVMSEVDAQADDGMTIDMETFEGIISSEANPEPTNNS